MSRTAACSTANMLWIVFMTRCYRARGSSRKSLTMNRDDIFRGDRCPNPSSVA